MSFLLYRVAIRTHRTWLGVKKTKQVFSEEIWLPFAFLFKKLFLVFTENAKSTQQFLCELFLLGKKRSLQNEYQCHLRISFVARHNEKRKGQALLGENHQTWFWNCYSEPRLIVFGGWDSPPLIPMNPSNILWSWLWSIKQGVSREWFARLTNQTMLLCFLQSTRALGESSESWWPLLSSSTSFPKISFLERKGSLV